MNQQATYSPEIQELFALGRPNAWPESGELPEQTIVDEYLNRCGLMQQHVGELLQVVRIWAEPQAEDGWDDVAGYAPIHAWRALGELQAVEAVEPLLALIPILGDAGDDWFMSEFPDVFGLIGPPALKPLTRYFEDRQQSGYDRHTAAVGMHKIAERHPECRGEVVERLIAVLDRHEEEAWEFYGFLIATLLDMKAVEAAEAIERAFSADVVADEIAGDWADVKDELGVEGLGLSMPKRESRRVQPMRQFHPSHIGGPTFPETPADLRKKKKRREKAKAKRKQKAKAAKRRRRSGK